MKRFTKQWWENVVDRMIRTGAETALGAGIASAQQFGDVNWKLMVQATLLGMLTSFLLAVAKLPEDDNKSIDIPEKE